MEDFRDGRMENGEWEMEDGKMEDGSWENGRRKMEKEDGRWKMVGLKDGKMGRLKDEKICIYRKTQDVKRK